MDGLNHSVITGKCLGCVAYQEKAARLEAANAAPAAALRDGLEKLRNWADDGEQKVWNHIVSNACKDMLAALSDGGEGWLPPEVREQARLAIGHAFHLIEHNKAMCVRCREAKQRLSAALDALKGE